MAFSFDTLVNDQKQSAIDVVDAITPSQVKQLGAAYKEGLNTSPKQVINETLGEFTGIDFSQTAGIDGLGAQAKNFIEAKGADLAMQLEQQILGCINTAIRDLMNKHPEVDFILNFEDRINGILGKFRNKLERKIDEELRKLTYQKLKVQQIALFKQRLRQKIKDICPAATPASVSEVQDFNNKIKGLINKRKSDNQPVDVTPTLKQEKIFEPKTETKTQAQTQPEPISEKAKKEYKKERVAKQVAKEKSQELKKEVEEETKKQLEQPEEEVIESLLDTTVEEEALKRWSAYYHQIIPLNWGHVNLDQIITPLFNKIISSVGNNIPREQAYVDEREADYDSLYNTFKQSPGSYFVTGEAYSTDNGIDSATGLHAARVDFVYEIKEKTNARLSKLRLSGFDNVRARGNSYTEASNSAIAELKEIYKERVSSAIKKI